MPRFELTAEAEGIQKFQNIPLTFEKKTDSSHGFIVHVEVILYVGKVNHVTFASLRSIVLPGIGKTRIRSRIRSRTRSWTVHTSSNNLNVICSPILACYTIETDCSAVKCSFSQLGFNIRVRFFCPWKILRGSTASWSLQHWFISLYI